MTHTKTTSLTLVATLVGSFICSIAAGQGQYPDPYLDRATQRDARLAYLSSQRAKAAVPVNYTFPVRPDIATAYSAAAYSPQYQYSNYASPYRAYPDVTPYAYPNRAYSNGAYQNAAQTAYRPAPLPYGTPNPYATYANPNVGYQNPYATNRPTCATNSNSTGAARLNPAINDAYYRAATAASAGQASPYYVGNSLAGSPKVYPTDEPVRNLFRYLLP